MLVYQVSINLVPVEYASYHLMDRKQYFLKKTEKIYFFFGLPHLASFISFFIEIAIAYIHPVYGRIQTHDLFDVSLLP
jgi:hypothetical protein